MVRCRWLVFPLLAALLGGCGGSHTGKGTTPGNPSNDASVCAYTKSVGSGRVYVQMAVTPVSLKATACTAFNEVFGGRRIPVAGRMGTGHVYCRWNKVGSSYTIKAGAFASARATGLAFCRSFHPGEGFKRNR